MYLQFFLCCHFSVNVVISSVNQTVSSPVNVVIISHAISHKTARDSDNRIF